MKRFSIRSAFAIILATMSLALADEKADTQPARNSKEYNLPAGKLAIQGYDPCSYFTGAPAPGSDKITLTVDGVIYRFVNEDNKKSFAANPYKYAPAYGGWCATAMAEGKKVEIDPKNYKITNGRLFLFFKAWYANAQNDWNKDEKNMTTQADAAWKKISSE